MRLPTSPWLWLALLVASVFPAPWRAVAAAVPDDGASRPEAVRARRIARTLEAGRVAEVVIDAVAAIKEFPEDGLLRLRLAQARLCEAIDLDGQLAQALDDAMLDRSLTSALDKLRRDDPPDPRANAEEAALGIRRKREAREKLLAPPVLAQIDQFQQSARQRFQESGGVLKRRSESLAEAFAGLRESRRLGMDSTERDLTELWCRVAVLLFRKQSEQLGTTGPGAGPNAVALGAGNPLASQSGALEKALAEFAEITPEATLRAAAELAKKRTTDAEALAGAADVIETVAGITGREDLLRKHVRGLLDHRYLTHPGLFVDELGPGARRAAQEFYVRSRDAESPDVVTSPGTVALQLYRKAWARDAEGTLPYLRLRLYLLERPFDPEEARTLLEEIRLREPRNAVVALEEARAAFLLDSKPEEGLKHAREAARMPEFSRSYLVAIPRPLRNVLKMHRDLSEWMGKGWPGYGWLFRALWEVQLFQLGEPVVHGPRDPTSAREAAVAKEMRELRLKLAEPVCLAPDYSDQSTGLLEKSNVLEELLSRKNPLSVAERLAFQRRQAEHRLFLDTLPRRRVMMRLSVNGLESTTSPSTGSLRNVEGPRVFLINGTVLSAY